MTSSKDLWNKASVWRWTALAIFALFVGTSLFRVDIKPRFSLKKDGGTPLPETVPAVAGEKDYASYVIPAAGVTLPAVWGDLGKKLTESGVIDKAAFEALYNNRGGMSDYERNLLAGEDNGNLKIDQQNANVLLNLLWALGLGQKSDVLDKGPMQDPQYGGADRFASTGGWSLAKGSAMDHYSKHEFVKLTSEQAALVAKVSKGIYRPCCGNSVYFPDCNHGIAMLGLLQLMASQGVGEDDMYKAALAVNSYWFPDTYLTIAKYIESQGSAWADVPASTLLGYDFSSSAGYKQILSQVEPVPAPQGGGGCGV